MNGYGRLWTIMDVKYIFRCRAGVALKCDQVTLLAVLAGRNRDGSTAQNDLTYSTKIES